MLPATIAFQRLQPIARRRKQIVQASCRVHHIKFAQRNGLDASPTRRAGAFAEQPLRGLVGKVADHRRQYVIRIS
jgi:hypothetical protein